MMSRPTGEFHQLDSGALQARIYIDTGHIELAGPDLSGRPLSNVVTFQPPVVNSSGVTLTIGRVHSVQTRDDVIDVVQARWATRR
jgi:hypothetical protein